MTNALPAPEPEADVGVLLHQLDESVRVAAVVQPCAAAGQYEEGGSIGMVHAPVVDYKVRVKLKQANQSPHRFLTCTVCTTLSPLPRMGACVNITTGRLAAAAFSSCN